VTIAVWQHKDQPPQTITYTEIPTETRLGLN